MSTEKETKDSNEACQLGLDIGGMHCGHCKASVEEAAAKIPGVSKPEVDLAAKELRFEESGPVDLEALKTAIRDIGFDPE